MTSTSVVGAPGFSRHTLGVAFEAMAHNRITLEIDAVFVATGDETVEAQWQVTH